MFFLNMTNKTISSNKLIEFNNISSDLNTFHSSPSASGPIYLVTSPQINIQRVIKTLVINLKVNKFELSTTLNSKQHSNNQHAY